MLTVPDAPQVPVKIGRIVDLSHELTPGREPTPLEVTHRRERVTPYTKMQDAIFVGSHTGTHMESELHYRYPGWNVVDIKLEDCIGPAVVLNFSHKGLKEAISLEELRAAGPIEIGDRVLLYTGWDQRYRTSESHLGPWPTAEACHWLVDDRHIRLFGTDGNAFDVIGDKESPNHRTFLSEASIPVIENLAHLDELRKQRVWLIAVPLRIRGLDASPIRALAIEEAD